MMLIVIDDELEQLRAMRPLDREVFNYLAERTDFNTAIVGTSRRVSYGGMALDLSESGIARRTKESLQVVTIVQLQNAIKRLVAVGLLDRLSENTKGSCLKLRRVFLANALGLHNSGQNPVARQLLFKQLTKLQAIVNKNNELSEKNNSSCQGNAVSVATTSYTTTTTIGNFDKFVMSLDWQPTQADLDCILQMSGIDKTKVNQQLIVDFKSYWHADGLRTNTQAQWTQRLSHYLIKFTKNPGAYESLTGSKPKPSTMGTNQPWASIPRDDDKLPGWARQHGFPDPQIGQSYLQYRQTLRNCVERKQKQEFKRLQ